MKRKTPATAGGTPERKRVLIVDDHPLVRMGMAEALRKDDRLVVCGEAASAEAALTAVEELQPDVVVADLNLPGKSGLELIKDLASLRPGLPVIVLSIHEEAIYAERCVRAGSRGYIMKSEAPEKLSAAIRHVLAGGVYVSERTSTSILETLSGRNNARETTPLSRLSDRELDVFRVMGQGLSTHEIADRLHIGAKTVETHRMNLKRKLGLKTVAGLVAYAARWIESAGEAPEK